MMSSDIRTDLKTQEEVPVMPSATDEMGDSIIEQGCCTHSEALLSNCDVEKEQSLDNEDKSNAEDLTQETSSISIKSRLRIRKETVNPQDNLHKTIKTTSFKKTNLRSKGLETIFEEPVEKKGKVYLTSASKSIRSLNINDGETISAKKKKIRKLKAKNVRTLFKRKKK